MPGLIGPWGFEGQSNTNPPTVANSDDFGDPAFSSVSTGGGMCVYSNAQAKYGTMSLRFNITTAATAAIVDSADTASSSVAAHCWIYIGTSPGGEIQGPIVFRNAAGAVNVARVQMTATNQFRNVLVTGGSGTASTATISTAGWYRVEAVVTGATGVASALSMTSNVYDSSGSLVIAVPSVSGGTGVNIDTIRWGKAGGSCRC